MDQTTKVNVDAVSLLVELFETVIHQILYTRRVYPTSIFALKKKYNIPVWISIHPGVNSYLSLTLAVVRHLAVKGILQSLSVIFFSNGGVPIERHVFHVLNIQPNLSDRSDPYLLCLEETFREFCLKFGSHHYKALPPESSFRLVVRTTEQGSVALSHEAAFQDFPFVKIQEKELQLDEPTIVPLHTVSCDFFHVQTYTQLN